MKKYWDQLPSDFEVGERIIYQPMPNTKDGSVGKVLQVKENTLVISTSILDRNGFEVSAKKLRKIN